MSSCHRVVMFFVILSGSGAVYAFTSVDAEIAKLVALLPATLGALDLTMNFQQRAREHNDLARSFFGLASKANGASDAEVTLRAEFDQLCADEPPIYKAVDAFAHNQLCDAWGQPERKMLVPWWCRVVRDFIRFSGRSFAVTQGH